MKAQTFRKTTSMGVSSHRLAGICRMKSGGDRFNPPRSWLKKHSAKLWIQTGYRHAWEKGSVPSEEARTAQSRPAHQKVVGDRLPRCGWKPVTWLFGLGTDPVRHPHVRHGFIRRFLDGQVGVMDILAEATIAWRTDWFSPPNQTTF
jgi:hypothetical protein